MKIFGSTQPFYRRTSVAKTFFLSLSVTLCALLFSSVTNAQSISEIRWKSMQQVRQVLGEPVNVRGPVGTHANYTMWEYPDFTVAFSNEKAFHLFRKNSLKKIRLEENR